MDSPSATQFAVCFLQCFTGIILRCEGQLLLLATRSFPISLSTKINSNLKKIFVIWLVNQQITNREFWQKKSVIMNLYDNRRAERQRILTHFSFFTNVFHFKDLLSKLALWFLTHRTLFCSIKCGISLTSYPKQLFLLA